MRSADGREKKSAWAIRATGDFPLTPSARGIQSVAHGLATAHSEVLIHATLQRTASAAFLVALLGPGHGRANAQPPPPETTHASEKEQRSPAERKIDSQLLYALYARRGESAARGTPAETSVAVDADGRTLIDVRAEVTPELLEQLRTLGGTVLSSSEPHRSVLARFPLERLVELASLKTVLFIQPAPEPHTN